MASPRLEPLAPLVIRLPFRIDDKAAVNALFVRWRAARRDADLTTIQLWAYCHFRRYFAVKLVRERINDAQELMDLVGKAYEQVCGHLDQVHQPERFTNWVNVISRNTLRNFLKRRRGLVHLSGEPEDHNDPLGAEFDRAQVAKAIRCAVANLPSSMRVVAKLRLLEQKSYKEVADATGLPGGTARAYTARALLRLREDPSLQRLCDELR